MKRDPTTTTNSAAMSLGRSGMTRDEIVAFFERRQERYDDFDAAALAADYADDAVIDSPLAGVHTGRAAAEQAYRAVFGAFLDRKMKTESLLIDGDRVARVVTMEGTNIGELMNLPPTGKPFRFTAVFLYELKDWRIVRERRVYDFTGLLVQIGVLKAKPV
ncbi:MAG: putative cyclase [Acidobacteria bacterium]|nr:putative cyclase [Acidobacteriota bacterium]